MSQEATPEQEWPEEIMALCCAVVREHPGEPADQLRRVWADPECAQLVEEHGDVLQYLAMRQAVWIARSKVNCEINRHGAMTTPPPEPEPPKRKPAGTRCKVNPIDEGVAAACRDAADAARDVHLNYSFNGMVIGDMTEADLDAAISLCDRKKAYDDRMGRVFRRLKTVCRFQGADAKVKVAIKNGALDAIWEEEKHGCED